MTSILNELCTGIMYSTDAKSVWQQTNLKERFARINGPPNLLYILGYRLLAQVQAFLSLLLNNLKIA